MSDMGDLYRAWRQAKQEKRASNRRESARILRENGVQFSSYNGGAHLVVFGPYQRTADFWPGTGKFIFRGGGKRGRGVRRLLAELKEDEAS